MWYDFMAASGYAECKCGVLYVPPLAAADSSEWSAQQSIDM
jgi:hypothetical protein